MREDGSFQAELKLGLVGLEELLLEVGGVPEAEEFRGLLRLKVVAQGIVQRT